MSLAAAKEVSMIAAVNFDASSFALELNYRLTLNAFFFSIINMFLLYCKLALTKKKMHIREGLKFCPVTILIFFFFFSNTSCLCWLLHDYQQVWGNVDGEKCNSSKCLMN